MYAPYILNLNCILLQERKTLSICLSAKSVRFCRICQNLLSKQECIPVGCVVKSASVSDSGGGCLPGVSTQGVSAQGGLPTGGVCLGGVCLGVSALGVSAWWCPPRWCLPGGCTPPPANRMTHRQV